MQACRTKNRDQEEAFVKKRAAILWNLALSSFYIYDTKLDVHLQIPRKAASARLAGHERGGEDHASVGVKAEVLKNAQSIRTNAQEASWLLHMHHSNELVSRSSD